MSGTAPDATPPEDPSAVLLAALGAHLGIPLAGRLVTMKDGVRVEIDGIDEAGRMLVQCIPAGVTVKSTQRNKAMADALKLVWLRSTLFVGARIALCVSEPVGRFFQPPAWLAQAVRDLRIEVFVVAPTVRSKVSPPEPDPATTRSCNHPILQQSGTRNTHEIYGSDNGRAT